MIPSQYNQAIGLGLRVHAATAKRGRKHTFALCGEYVTIQPSSWDRRHIHACQGCLAIDQPITRREVAALAAEQRPRTDMLAAFLTAAEAV